MSRKLQYSGINAHDKDGQAMAIRLTSILLWLFVMNLGVAFGAGLYEGRVVVPGWAETSPQTWPNTGLMFWVYVTTVPLTLLTIANAVAAWRDLTPRRHAWRAAVAIALLERVVTFGYFIPRMVSLMAESSAGPEVSAALGQWLWLNQGRHVLTLSAWVAALRALSLSHARLS